ncbi:MAG: hypothetical protein M3N13_11170, partial [Candidatus Eremiobacteraeota bacterium]|nr:hypothetical protein [Candidatus Eremiobacteraeota bacterium]
TDIGPSHLVKATFYIGSIGGGPGLITAIARCYDLKTKADRLLVTREYRRQAIASTARPSAKLTYRLRNVTLRRENWYRTNA